MLFSIVLLATTLLTPSLTHASANETSTSTSSPMATASDTHSEFIRVRNENFPDAEVKTVIPDDFYEITSEIGLVVMMGTGERSHYSSVLSTLGYLPELQ